ncbi:MAG: YwiC-like family protein, partial [Thermoleophilia bacterium]|nr:YwiC-like family protein [Thermoleophilia bacterium]
IAGVIFLFFCRAPLALLLKRRAIDGFYGPEAPRLWLNFVVFAIAGSSVFLYFIIADELWQLAVAAFAGIMLFLFHELLVWRRRERSVSAELAGVALLTLTAPLSVILSGCDSCWRLAVVLWLLNAMYFGASVFYVKMRLKTRAHRRKPASAEEKMTAARGSFFYMAVVSVMLGLLVLTGAMPVLAAAAFIPTFGYQIRCVAKGATAMTLKAEGVAQTVLSVLFALILIASFEV